MRRKGVTAHEGLTTIATTCDKIGHGARPWHHGEDLDINTEEWAKCFRTLSTEHVKSILRFIPCQWLMMSQMQRQMCGWRTSLSSWTQNSWWNSQSPNSRSKSHKFLPLLSRLKRDWRPNLQPKLNFFAHNFSLATLQHGVEAHPSGAAPPFWGDLAATDWQNLEFENLLQIFGAPIRPIFLGHDSISTKHEWHISRLEDAAHPPDYK